MDTQELQRLKNKFDIVGNDAGLNHALETAAAVAPTDLTVLITGESGVGKENIPQIIHQLSRRKTGKYLPVNCGAIPAGTINAELFGHEKGAFTGAIGERKGYLEVADGDTLFLDEIGELPKDTQAMLLRVLQSGEYMKVGSSKVEKTDVRVIAATNLDLRQAVARGTFREDLYYRLNAVQIQMPALRERRDDIYLLFRKFTSDTSERYNLKKISLTHDAIARLRDYRWPGNIRELKNIAEAITAMLSVPVTPGADRIELNAEDIAAFLPDEKDTMLPMATPAGASGPGSMSDDDKRMIVKALLDLNQEVERLKKRLDALQQPSDGIARPAPAPLPQGHAPAVQEAPEEAEWQEPAEEEELSIRKMSDDMIERALQKHGGNVKLAAEQLGISERTIYRKRAQKKKP